MTMDMKGEKITSEVQRPVKVLSRPGGQYKD